MGQRKGGRRLSKRQVADAVQGLFQQHPGEALSFKQVFKALKLDTHPAKMLAVDVMEEMAWDDYLSKVDNSTYRLNLKTQVQEGTFIRKANGKNSFMPDDGGKPIFVTNATFAQRVYDQMTQDVSLNGSPVTVLLCSASIFGMGDATHIGISAIGMFSNIPGIKFLCPTSREEYLAMLDYGIPCAGHLRRKSVRCAASRREFPLLQCCR